MKSSVTNVTLYSADGVKHGQKAVLECRSCQSQYHPVHYTYKEKRFFYAEIRQSLTEINGSMYFDWLISELYAWSV